MSEPREPVPAAAPRRPGKLRRWVVRPFFWALLLLVAAVAGAWFFLQSQLAREKALERAVVGMSQYLHRKIAIGSIDFTLFPLAVELRDVVIPGPHPGDPPVARVPLVAVQISLDHLRKRVFDIEEIEVFRPEVYLQFNPDGSSNLPTFGSPTPGRPSHFEVRIGHLLVQDGTFRLNERQSPLRLDARAIWGRMIGRADRGDHGGDRLDLLATAQEVVTTLPRAKPYRLTVSAKGSIVPDAGRIQLAAVRLAGPDLKGTVDGFIAYRPKEYRVDLNLQANVGVAWVNRVGYADLPLAGPAAGRAHFVWVPSGWSYSGTATSPRLAALGRVIQDVETRFSGGPDGVDVQVERSRYAGGSIKGLVSVDTGEKGPGTPVSLDLELADLALHQLLTDQFPHQDLPIAGGLSARTGGTFEYRFNSERPLAGSGKAALHLRGTGETGLPVDGDLPVVLTRGVISGHDLHLTMPGQEVAASSVTYDLQRDRGQADFQLTSRDVGPLGPILLGPPKPGEPPAFWLPSVGHGTAQGTIDFAGKEYSLRLGLDLAGVVAPVTAADTVRGSLSLNPRAVDDLRLEMSRGGGALMVTGRVPFAASQPLTLAIDAAQWPAAGLAYLVSPDLLAKFQGELSGRVDLTGFANHLSGRVDASVASLVAYGVPLGTARAAIAFDGDKITVEQGQVNTPAGSVFAHGSLDQASGAMSLTARGPALALDAEPFRRYLAGRRPRRDPRRRGRGDRDAEAAAGDRHAARPGPRAARPAARPVAWTIRRDQRRRPLGGRAGGRQGVAPRALLLRGEGAPRPPGRRRGVRPAQRPAGSAGPRPLAAAAARFRRLSSRARWRCAPTSRPARSWRPPGSHAQGRLPQADDRQPRAGGGGAQLRARHGAVLLHGRAGDRQRAGRLGQPSGWPGTRRSICVSRAP